MALIVFKSVIFPLDTGSRSVDPGHSDRPGRQNDGGSEQQRQLLRVVARRRCAPRAAQTYCCTLKVCAEVQVQPRLHVSIALQLS